MYGQNRINLWTWGKGVQKPNFFRVSFIKAAKSCITSTRTFRDHLKEDSLMYISDNFILILFWKNNLKISKNFWRKLRSLLFLHKILRNYQKSPEYLINTGTGTVNFWVLNLKKYSRSIFFYVDLKKNCNCKLSLLIKI